MDIDVTDVERQVVIMFKIGDTICYGTTGVCTIDNTIERTVKGEVKKYYVLKPIFQNNATVYVPADNEELTSRMKNVLTSDEVENIIEHIPEYPCKWIVSDSERTRKFRETMVSGDRTELTKMVRMLYVHRQKQYAKGRRLHASDEHFLKDAESLLFGEFALVLGIKPDEVPGYIDKKIAG